MRNSTEFSAWIFIFAATSCDGSDVGLAGPPTDASSPDAPAADANVDAGDGGSTDAETIETDAGEAFTVTMTEWDADRNMMPVFYTDSAWFQLHIVSLCTANVTGVGVPSGAVTLTDGAVTVFSFRSPTLVVGRDPFAGVVPAGATVDVSGHGVGEVHATYTHCGEEVRLSVVVVRDGAPAIRLESEPFILTCSA